MVDKGKQIVDLDFASPVFDQNMGGEFRGDFLVEEGEIREEVGIVDREENGGHEVGVSNFEGSGGALKDGI